MFAPQVVLAMDPFFRGIFYRQFSCNAGDYRRLSETPPQLNLGGRVFEGGLLIRKRLCWERWFRECLGAAARCCVSFLNSPNVWNLYQM